jgi:hypothetical protein
MSKAFMMDGPIPGENYTSDTRNYPWHRPPEFTSTDDAIDYVAKVFSKEEAIASTVTMMEIGIDIATITDIFITKGISEGKWAVDLGLIIAGPVAHMIVMMAKAYGVPVRLGLNNDFDGPTSLVFKTIKKDIKKLSKEKQSELQQNISGASEEGKTKQKASGFMQGPSMMDEEEPEDNSEEEQQEMM